MDMTGRDLIMYILENNLENEPVYKDGTILGFISMEEAATRFEVGMATIRKWINDGVLPGMKIGENIYIPAKCCAI